MAVMGLGIKQGETITVTVEGEDETVAAEEIAALKGVSYEEVVRQTTENAKKLYRLEK